MREHRNIPYVHDPGQATIGIYSEVYNTLRGYERSYFVSPSVKAWMTAGKKTDYGPPSAEYGSNARG